MWVKGRRSFYLREQTSEEVTGRATGRCSRFTRAWALVTFSLSIFALISLLIPRMYLQLNIAIMRGRYSKGLGTVFFIVMLCAAAIAMLTVVPSVGIRLDWQVTTAD